MRKRKKLEKKNEGEIGKMFIPVLEDGDGIPKGYFVIKIHKGSRYEVERQLTSFSLFIIDKGTVSIYSSHLFLCVQNCIYGIRKVAQELKQNGPRHGRRNFKDTKSLNVNTPTPYSHTLSYICTDANIYAKNSSISTRII